MDPKSSPWFECYADMPGNPLTKRLALEIKRSIALTVGHLHCLWSQVNQHKPTGDLTGMRHWEIERWAQWSGPPGYFVEGLETVGLLLRVEGELLLCDWKGRPHPSIYPKPMNRDDKTEWSY